MITQEKSFVEISKNVNNKQADTLIREYKQARWVPNSERIGKPDALSAWYSIEDMEAFIETARSNGGDGVKFYFGAFPEDYVAQPEYSGRQTLVMVATKSKTSGNDVVTNKDIYITNNGHTQILGGVLPIPCPPSCGLTTEGGMGDLGITIVDRGQKGLEIV
jgi:hypothetical protein